MSFIFLVSALMNLILLSPHLLQCNYSIIISVCNLHLCWCVSNKIIIHCFPSCMPKIQNNLYYKDTCLPLSWDCSWLLLNLTYSIYNEYKKCKILSFLLGHPEGKFVVICYLAAVKVKYMYSRKQFTNWWSKVKSTPAFLYLLLWLATQMSSNSFTLLSICVA